MWRDHQRFPTGAERTPLLKDTCKCKRVALRVGERLPGRCLCRRRTSNTGGTSPSFHLAGNDEVDLAGLTLATADVAVTADGLKVSGSWLGRFAFNLGLDGTVSHPRCTAAPPAT
jgi:hypothetical protein